MVNVLAFASVDGWSIDFPLSLRTVVYAALCELAGIFLNHTSSVQSAVQLDKFQELGVHKTGVVSTGEVSVLFVSVSVLDAVILVFNCVCIALVTHFTYANSDKDG